MITNLSPPYPDEVFYSWFGLYHYLTGNPTISHTLTELFNLNNKKGQDMRITAPKNLNFFCSQIPPSFNISSANIIKNNTIFPLFQPFLPKSIIELVIKGMKEKTTFHLNDMMGFNSCDFPTNNIVNICKQCVIEDIRTVGEGYIHRTHQIPGCFTCHKHHIPLEYVDLADTEYLNKFFTINSLIEKVHPYKIDKKIFNSLLLLTSDIVYLTNSNLDNYDVVKIRNTFEEKLLITGYSNINGRVDEERLQNDFLDFYNKDYLIFLDSYVNKDTKINWLSYITKNRVEKIHPIKYLLFIRFLFGGIKEFVNFNEKYEPFGNAPWPCLNKQCDHYKKDTIDSYELIKSRYKGKIDGKFKCSKCGFVYTRCGPDTAINDRYIIKTIVEYGYAWEKNLKDLLVSHNYSIDYLRKTLKCGPEKMALYILSHDLLHYLNEKDQIIIQNKPTNGLIKQYKNTILQYINNNKKATRSEIYLALQNECALIIRRDIEWYEKKLPAPLKKELGCQVIGDYVDWHKRDLELSNKVIVAIKELKDTTGSRISLKQISIKINSPSITNQKYLSKLPIMQKIINDSSESNDDYLKRKGDYIIRNLLSKGETITAGKLREKLKITSKSNDNVNNYIKKLLFKYIF